MKLGSKFCLGFSVVWTCITELHAPEALSSGGQSSHFTVAVSIWMAGEKATWAHCIMAEYHVREI